MRKLILIFVFLFTLVGVFAQPFKMPADTEFFYLYGGVNSDIGRCIKETPDGGYIIAGTTSSFGPGDASVYLVKTDSLGKHLWSNTYGGSQNDWGYSVEVTADSGYFVCGYSNSFNPANGFDAYYFKTDKKGNQLWQKTVGGFEWDFIYGSAAMPDGGFILCGETFTNSNGGTDAWLIRVNKNGDTLWTKHYGGLYDETFNSVALMNNRIYAVGKNQTHSTASDTAADGWIVKLDTNGTILKDAFIRDTCANTCHHFEEILLGITPYTNSIFHFSGRVNLLDTNISVSILGRADTSLTLSWISMDTIGPTGTNAVLYHVINLDGGNICAMGFATGGLGGENMVFEGFDFNGNFINGFLRHSGGIKDDYGYYGIYTSKNRIIGIGSSESFCAGLEDVFLVRFNGDTIQNGPLTAQSPKIVCFTDTLSLSVVSIHSYSDDLKINLFPNPASNTTHLKINCIGQKTFFVKVFSVLGTEVFISKTESNINNTLDLSLLQEGSFFLKIQDENGQNRSVLKLIINR